MRIFFLLLALVFTVAGVLFGALNGQAAMVDFYFFTLDASLGVLLLGGALLGAICGGVAVIVGVVWPLQRRLARARRQHAGDSGPTRGVMEPGNSGTPGTELMLRPDRP